MSDDDWDPLDDEFEVERTPPEHYRGMEALIAFLASSDAGARALAWLRSFTTERSLPPVATPTDALWHLEGQRALVLGLETRVKQFLDRRN